MPRLRIVVQDYALGLMLGRGSVNVEGAVQQETSKGWRYDVSLVHDVLHELLTGLDYRGRTWVTRSSYSLPISNSPIAAGLLMLMDSEPAGVYLDH